MTTATIANLLKVHTNPMSRSESRDREWPAAVFVVGGVSGVGGGGSGAMSRFAERNPIYRLGIARSTTGVGFSYKLADAIKVEGGYLAKNGSNPNQKAGLFNGNYSAMGQLVFQPAKRFKFGLTYVNGYDPGDGTFAFGGTGTNFANGLLPGTEERRISSNSYGVQDRKSVV